MEVETVGAMLVPREKAQRATFHLWVSEALKKYIMEEGDCFRLQEQPQGLIWKEGRAAVEALFIKVCKSHFAPNAYYRRNCITFNWK